MFGLWCNGSTTGFGSVCPGSNPGSPTTIQLIAAKNPLKSQVLVGFFVILSPSCWHYRYRFFRLSSYLVWVGVKFSNAKEEELLINDASQIGSKKFDFSIE